ncbi:MAG: glycosyltransferase [Candidatus Humimicrobiaceae bacterium]
MTNIAGYKKIVGEDRIEQLQRLAALSSGKKVVMVNSTKDGGGVAEILTRLVPLLTELGIDCRWETIEGDDAFFNITKSMHNAMQGKKINFSPQMLDHYQQIARENAARLNLDADIVIIHDPQPLALIEHCKKRGAKWVWRCHIDTSKPELSLWKYLKRYLLDYDASIYSIAKFSRVLAHPQYLIAPSVDPLADKNRYLSKEKVASVLSSFGIKKEKPFITQVSRFDKFKDPLGAIDAYRMVKREIDVGLILAGGTASDDPEGQAVLSRVKEKAGDDPDIHILLLSPKSDIEINAIQRASDVVLQKSVKEGFGLVVTEAMWKKKPVVAGAAGGITIQLQNHQTGFLVHSAEGAAYRIRYLLNRGKIREKMGKDAREHVRNNFLITRHLRDYLSLFRILENAKKSLIYV